MKYLKIYEEFEFWEEISADDWYDSKYQNQPFNETEYDTLVNFCIDNDEYKKGGQEYEIDYDYVNPNKMGYGFHSGGRAWRFTILKYEKFYDADENENYTAEHTTLTLFKKGESKDGSSLYFLSCEDHSTSRWKYFECDRFQDLMYLIKKHLDL